MKRKLLPWLLMLLVFVAGCGGAGDRVLVSKCYYDGTPWEPSRYDVVVFRFPREPIQDGTPTNYIKRLLGLAGETIAVFLGQIFVSTEPVYNDFEKTEDKNTLWQKHNLHMNNDVDLFKKGGFKIARKSPATMMSMRRLVYNNDYQAKDLREAGFSRRWSPASSTGWQAKNDDKEFTHAGSGDKIDWLRYQHILRPRNWPEVAEQDKKPQLITDFSGYNSYAIHGDMHDRHPNCHWVGDLMLEVDVQVEKSQGEFRLELSRGVDRFQARWDLATGKCSLYRLQDGKNEKQLGQTVDTSLKQPGTYQVRFANFDQRLTLWVNGGLVFGDGEAYKRPWGFDNEKNEWVRAGPTANDLEPASVGSQGASVQVRKLRLWRDTYYTVRNGSTTEHAPRSDVWSDPNQWNAMRTSPPLLTMYVQKGHYLVMGDNSPESSDSREWGLVPQRLMLGRALMVYWPWDRLGTIIH